LGVGQVDWTIRLIVINSKLSGANSFQATVEACFGRSGLIAISVSLYAHNIVGVTCSDVLDGCCYADSAVGLVRLPCGVYTPIHWVVLTIGITSAFGGMVAFCIIIGDTIPHVMGALFPELHGIPFLNLLVNRRAIIIIFTLGISYPLSLYRDIAKVSD
jgi:solute carrier family 38 (sodium-coupled neutral amino acid transporter), member 11